MESIGLMPSFFHLMVGLGGTALAASAIMLWLQQPPQTPTEADTSASSSRMVGNSALSHGGPPRTSGPTAAGSFSPAFQIGQRVIVASEEYASQTVSLLTSPPDSAASVPPSGVTRTLSGGTVVIVGAMRIIERAPGLTEQYYEVVLADGGRGWLPRRGLRQEPVSSKSDVYE
jgi:hypothetical protein